MCPYSCVHNMTTNRRLAGCFKVAAARLIGLCPFFAHFSENSDLRPRGLIWREELVAQRSSLMVALRQLLNRYRNWR